MSTQFVDELFYTSLNISSHFEFCPFHTKEKLLAPFDVHQKKGKYPFTFTYKKADESNLSRKPNLLTVYGQLVLKGPKNQTDAFCHTV